MPPERLNSIAEDLLTRLPGSPGTYPQKIDLISETVLLVEFDAHAYRSASFLDDRILGPNTKGAWIPIARAAAAAKLVTCARPLHFIFHTGHVGSTLVSRLLDETGTILSLREPLPLRTLAEAHDVLGQSDSLVADSQFDLTFGMLIRLWGRGYQETCCIVLKATSSAGRLAAPILARSERSRAIYLNVQAEPYLATLLAGQNSAIDLRGHGPERMRRLRSLIAAPLTPLSNLSIGELAAMSWLAESWTQRDTLKRFAGRVIALDFDQFLSTIADSMGRILVHFELPADVRYLSEVARSPVLARYSKAPEYAYTPDIRAELLRDSRRHNGDEIRKGMDWLERLARSDEPVAEIMTGADTKI
jgi:hypothetical protein